MVGSLEKKENRPQIVFWVSIPCVFCLYIHLILKVVSHLRVSNLGVLYMLVTGFQKKNLDRGMGGVNYIQFFWAFRMFNFAKPLSNDYIFPTITYPSSPSSSPPHPTSLNYHAPLTHL